MRVLPALALALALALAACRPAAPADPAADASPDGSAGAVPAAYDPSAPLPETSLYALDAPWTTDAGATLRLADLRGRPVVVAMMYAHCAYACPLIVRDMKALAAELPAGGDVRYVLVSLDPERDTVEGLRSFREGFGLDDAWTLLRGDARDVRQLAALLGVRYRTEPDGTISHGNRITVLDRDGRIVARQDGLGAGSADAVDALRGLLAAR